MQWVQTMINTKCLLKFFCNGYARITITSSLRPTEPSQGEWYGLASLNNSLLYINLTKVTTESSFLKS